MRKNTIIKIIMNESGLILAKNIYKKNITLFNDYKKQDAIKFITVVLHTLWKENKIKKVSRGIFTTNLLFEQIDWNNEESVVKYFTKNDNGFVAGEYLWWKNDLLKSFPKKILIYSNLVVNKRRKMNIEIRPSKIVITKENIKIFELFELVRFLKYDDEFHIKIIKHFLKTNELKIDQLKNYESLFKRGYKKIQKFIPYF